MQPVVVKERGEGGPKDNVETKNERESFQILRMSS